MRSFDCFFRSTNLNTAAIEWKDFRYFYLYFIAISSIAFHLCLQCLLLCVPTDLLVAYHPRHAQTVFRAVWTHQIAAIQISQVNAFYLLQFDILQASNPSKSAPCSTYCLCSDCQLRWVMLAKFVNHPPSSSIILLHLLLVVQFCRFTLPTRLM